MVIVAWILLGALAGWIASLVLKVKEEQALIANIVVGVIGALIGGSIMQLFSITGIEEGNIYSFLFAALAALLLLTAYQRLNSGV